MQLHIAALLLGLVPAAPAADLEQGKAKSLACQACHGSNGIGTAGDVPNLAGQKPAYLAAQLSAFRKGDRKHELMNPIASQLTDPEITNLAAYWSSLPAAGTADPHGATDAAAGLRASRMTFPVNFPAEYVVFLETKGEDGKLASKSWVTRPAVAAAAQGQPLPDDTTIVVENFANGAVDSYAAMGTHRGWGEGIPELLKNADWSYGLYDARQQPRAFNYARCLACHKPQAATSYVFGYEAIGKAGKASG